MGTQLKPLLLALMIVAGIGFAASPADAHDFRHPGFGRSPASVFPAPHDPWRSWSLRSQLPHRVGPSPPVIVTPTHVPGPVWVPGRWLWDGTTWVWWPGRWVH
jgi:hypothetical protein